MSRDALARFAAKCRFKASTGCVIWVGGMSTRHAGESKAPAFSYEGKRWPARRWAACFIHGLPIKDREAQVTCGHPYCMEHVTTAAPVGNRRQFWLLVNLGYDEIPEEEKAALLAAEQAIIDQPLDAPGEHIPPAWFRPYVENPFG